MTDVDALKRENMKLKGLLRDAVRLLNKYKQLMLKGQPIADGSQSLRKPVASKKARKTKASRSPRRRRDSGLNERS